MEIYSENKPDNEVFKSMLIKHGGKVSQNLTRYVTHVVWSQGRTKTLEKALDYENTKIVTSLWLQKSFEEMRLANEDLFRPGAIERVIEKRKKRE